MQTKGDRPIDQLSGSQISALISLYFEVNHLKQVFRQGWLQRGVSRGRCESVADHAFGVIVLALFLNRELFQKLDPLKVLRLSVLHDLGEFEIGDLTPADRISPKSKVEAERHSLMRLFSGLSGEAEYLEIWDEYIRGDSEEAKFVRQVDKLEMALQASVYEHQGLGELRDFFDSAEAQMKDPAFLKLLREVRKLREED